MDVMVGLSLIASVLLLIATCEIAVGNRRDRAVADEYKRRQKEEDPR